MKKWPAIIKRMLMLFIPLMLQVASTGVKGGEKLIQLTASQCQVTVSIPGGNDCNNASQCGNDSACICANKGEHIKWTITGDDRFKLKFSSTSPLKDNCGKNFKKGKHKCVIKDSLTSGNEFTYDIRLESCSNGTDPKIVIK